ncbi:Gfo/Idh/MocA family protein [Croceiramulus getboli]|nr:Gfo/Idh/MocA family oxidoreductase [Flavobacteriaceae bacterium YJPT1-3]
MKTMNRRVFGKKMIKGVAAGGVLMGLPLSCAFGEAKKDTKKLGVALVGLGSYSAGQLAPALQHTNHCYLAGIVTGTPAKETRWANQYGIPEKNIYNYENFDTIADNKDIDIVYVVLPNSMHAEFSIRAAKAGKHVICEKPMAINVEECDAIIQACEEAGIKLSVGYRLQSEPYTQQVQQWVAKQTFGATQQVDAAAAYVSRGYPDQWRLNKALSGGGALMNMGVYAIQGAIYGTGANPIAVSAREESTRPDYFKDTDETVYANFVFPDGAQGQIFTSHNASASTLDVQCIDGFIQLDPAYTYGPLAGKSSKGPMTFPHDSQQKLQMDDFALHIKEGAINQAPGAMGKRDMIIIEAIYRSIAEDGKTIPLDLGTMGLGGPNQ